MGLTEEYSQNVANIHHFMPKCFNISGWIWSGFNFLIFVWNLVKPFQRKLYLELISSTSTNTKFQTLYIISFMYSFFRQPGRKLSTTVCDSSFLRVWFLPILWSLQRLPIQGQRSNFVLCQLRPIGNRSNGLCQIIHKPLRICSNGKIWTDHQLISFWHYVKRLLLSRIGIWSACSSRGLDLQIRGQH